MVIKRNQLPFPGQQHEGYGRIAEIAGVCGGQICVERVMLRGSLTIANTMSTACTLSPQWPAAYTQHCHDYSSSLQILEPHTTVTSFHSLFPPRSIPAFSSTGRQDRREHALYRVRLILMNGSCSRRGKVHNMLIPLDYSSSLLTYFPLIETTKLHKTKTLNHHFTHT